MDKRDRNDSKDKLRDDDRERQGPREDTREKGYDPRDGTFSEGDRKTPSIADTIEPPDEPPKK